MRSARVKVLYHTGRLFKKKLFSLGRMRLIGSRAAKNNIRTKWISSSENGPDTWHLVPKWLRRTNQTANAAGPRGWIIVGRRYLLWNVTPPLKGREEACNKCKNPQKVGGKTDWCRLKQKQRTRNKWSVSRRLFCSTLVWFWRQSPRPLPFTPILAHWFGGISMICLANNLHVYTLTKSNLIKKKKRKKDI